MDQVRDAHPVPILIRSPPSFSSTIMSLPPSLQLPPHLSAHKYFFVCTLTVAAWDTLVLSPRTWRLMKSPGWPALKFIFHFLRIFMPLEFVVVGMRAHQPFLFFFSPVLVAIAFFDTKWSQAVIFLFLYDYRSAHSSSRPVKNSIFLSPSAPPYSLLQLLVRPRLFYASRY